MTVATYAPEDGALYVDDLLIATGVRGQSGEPYSTHPADLALARHGLIAVDSWRWGYQRISVRVEKIR